MTEQAAPQCYRHPGRATWITCQRCGRPICPDCMIPASVGFQCPACVNEGRKTARAPRTAFGGRLGTRAGETTIVLIVINVFMWLLTTITGGYGSKLYSSLTLLPKGTCVGSNGTSWYPFASGSKADCAGVGHWVAGATDGAPWQIITSAFMHVEPVHIAVNMISLWFVGPALEAMFGRARFLAIYFVSALAGSVAVLLFSDAHTATLGASGAIFGLMGALFVLSRRTPALFNQVIFWVALNLIFTFTVSGISWQAHVGGLIGGAITATALIAMNDQQRRKRTAGL